MQQMSHAQEKFGAFFCPIKGLRLYTFNVCCDFRCDFLLLMYVNEWTSYEYFDEGMSNRNLVTRSHPSEEEDCTGHRENGPLYAYQTNCMHEISQKQNSERKTAKEVTL
jgi:hypothetical protein